MRIYYLQIKITCKAQAILFLALLKNPESAESYPVSSNTRYYRQSAFSSYWLDVFTASYIHNRLISSN